MRKDIKKETTLCGWAHSRRDHGGVIFIDLRDRYGTTQVVFDPSHNKIAHEKAPHIGREWVLQVTGHARERPQGMANLKIHTGEIEVIADNLEVLNASEVPPIEIEDRTEPNEETRLKYRYLDLRRHTMQQRLLLRHKTAQAAREYLSGKEFVEIETPMLVKTKTGGGRDLKTTRRVLPG